MRWILLCWLAWLVSGCATYPGYPAGRYPGGYPAYGWSGWPAYSGWHGYRAYAPPPVRRPLPGWHGGHLAERRFAPGPGSWHGDGFRAPHPAWRGGFREPGHAGGGYHEGGPERWDRAGARGPDGRGRDGHLAPGPGRRGAAAAPAPDRGDGHAGPGRRGGGDAGSAGPWGGGDFGSPGCQSALKSFQGRAPNSFQMSARVIGV